MDHPRPSPQSSRMPGESVDSVVRRLDEVQKSGADETIMDFGLAVPSPDERFDSAQ